MGLVDNCVITNCRSRNGNSYYNGRRNDGGGVQLYNGGTVRNCRIENCYSWSNASAYPGGGVAIYDAGLVENCSIVKCHANRPSGGGVYLDGGRLENSIVVGNVADRTGGGIQNAGGRVVNCLVCDNVAAQAGTGVCQSKGSLLNLTIADNCTNKADVVGCSVTGGTMKNCIVWGNEGTVQLAASDEIAGDSSNWWAADPCFKSVARGDYRLKSSSKCIDAGDDTAWADLSGAVDLMGGQRLLNRHVDIGCYECALWGLVLLLY